MTNIVIGRNNWLDIYREATQPRAHGSWVCCTLSNDLELFISTMHSLKEIKKYCKENKVFITKAGLQFRDNHVEQDTGDVEAVYISKSVRGYIGGTINECVTIGKLVDGIVYKKAYCLPELVELYKSEDPIDECFEELVIYNDKKANKKKQL